MGLFGTFKEIKRTANMARAERVAAQQEEGMEPLLLILIEEVRQLRRDFAAFRDDEEPGRR